MILRLELNLTDQPVPVRVMAARLADVIVPILFLVARKNHEYGASWRKRGGVDSFMMLARKWDRIENQVQAHGWNILKLCEDDRADGPRDDLRDLIGYLMLVLEHVGADPMSVNAILAGFPSDPLAGDPDAEPATTPSSDHRGDGAGGGGRPGDCR